jgi:hypothetical protein
MFNPNLENTLLISQSELMQTHLDKMYHPNK